jgi:hypothetical protein
LVFETEWNWIAYSSLSLAEGYSTYHNIVKDIFAWQVVTRDFLLALFGKSDDNVMKSLSSKDILTYYEAQEHILNLASEYHSSNNASSKTSKP